MQLCSFLASGITSCFLWHLHYSTSRAVLCCTVVQCKTSFDLLDVGSYRLTRCKTIFWRRFLSHDLFLVAKAAVFVHSLEITWVVFSQFSFSAQVVFDLADAMPCHLSRARCKFSLVWGAEVGRIFDLRVRVGVKRHVWIALESYVSLKGHRWTIWFLHGCHRKSFALC